MFLYDIRTQQKRSSKSKIIESTLIVKNPIVPDRLLEINLNTKFASIDLIIRNLIKKCKFLRQQLQEIILYLDTSIVKNY